MINRFVFTLLSTSWVWVVYGIEQRWSFVFGNVLLTSFALISVPFLLTIVWIVLAKCFLMIILRAVQILMRRITISLLII